MSHMALISVRICSRERSGRLLAASGSAAAPFRARFIGTSAFLSAPRAEVRLRRGERRAVLAL